MTGTCRLASFAASALAATLAMHLSLGAVTVPPGDLARALFAFDETRYEHVVVQYQRLPRAGIAIFVGAMMAISGTVLQGLTRNPLASPSLLGINAGAMFAVVFVGFYLGVSPALHGAIAFAGAWFGFGCCLALTRLAALGKDPRHLGLILAGAVTSILLGAIANALLLSDPGLRDALLGWVNGNINHVYADRLGAAVAMGAARGAAALGVVAAPNAGHVGGGDGRRGPACRSGR